MAQREQVKAADDLAKRIAKILAGKNPEIVGAALAQCCAVWVAGHAVINDPKETARMQAALLSMHFMQVTEAVRMLTVDKANLGSVKPAGRA